MARLAFGILLLLALLCAGCTPEQNKQAGQTLTTTGKVLKTGAEVVSTVVPGPSGILLTAILGGLATVATGIGQELRRRGERKKKKAYKAQLSAAALEAANKQIFGDKFRPELSKF